MHTQFEDLGYNGTESLDFVRWLARAPYLRGEALGIPQKHQPKWPDVQALPSHDGTSHLERIHLTRTPLNTKQYIEEEVKHLPVHPLLHTPGVAPILMPDQDGTLLQALGGASSMDDLAATRFWAEGGVRPLHPALVPQDMVQACKEEIIACGKGDMAPDQRRAYDDLVEGIKWLEVKDEQRESDGEAAGLSHVDKEQVGTDQDARRDTQASGAHEDEGGARQSLEARALEESHKKLQASKTFIRGFLLPKNRPSLQQNTLPTDTQIPDSSRAADGSQRDSKETRRARAQEGLRSAAVDGDGHDWRHEASSRRVAVDADTGDSPIEVGERGTNVRSRKSRTEARDSEGDEGYGLDADGFDEGKSSKQKAQSRSKKAHDHQPNPWMQDAREAQGADRGGSNAHSAATSALTSLDEIMKMPGVPHSVDPADGREFERLVQWGGEEASRLA